MYIPGVVINVSGILARGCFAYLVFLAKAHWIVVWGRWLVICFMPPDFLQRHQIGPITLPNSGTFHLATMSILSISVCENEYS